MLRFFPTNSSPIPTGLAKPLRAWLRNYACALKILELERADLKPVARALTLMDWMATDFRFGASAALLSLVYLAPNSAPRKGAFKNNSSADREAALEGARNAAWDLTHLSEFVGRVNQQSEAGGSTRYIFASFDKLLRRLARYAFDFGAEPGKPDLLATALSEWWPAGDASALSEALFGHLQRLSAPDWKQRDGLSVAELQQYVAEGEEKVRRLIV